MNGKRIHLPWEVCVTTGSYSAEVSKSHISPETSRHPLVGQGGGLTDG